jgi:hypothetical protein
MQKLASYVDMIDEMEKKAELESRICEAEKHHITVVNTVAEKRRKRDRGKAGTNSRHHGYARLRARNASQLRARTRNLESLLFLPLGVEAVK